MRRWSWLLLLVPTLGLASALTLSFLWNEDFWWYLTGGRMILATGGLPRTDPFLYTSGSAPQGWVYHSWLWTTIVAAVDRVAGLDGVVILGAGVVAATVLLLYTTARCDRWGLVNAAFVTVFLVAGGQRLAGKAEIASLLLLAVVYRLLEARGAFGWRRGVALAGLQWLWSNLHGGYPLGVFAVTSYAIGGWLERRFPARRAPSTATSARAPDSRPPVWMAGVAFAVSVADPWHWRDKLAPFGFVGRSAAYQPVGRSGRVLITEWHSPFGGDDPVLPWLYALLVGLALLSFLARRGRPDGPRLLLFAGLAILGATAIRHLVPLALGAGLVGLSNAGEAMAAAPRRGRRSAVHATASVALGAFLIAAGIGMRVLRARFEVGQSAEHFFVLNPSASSPGAADFVRRQPAADPLFNDYQLGAYLEARLFPDHRLFIDARVLDPRLVVTYTEMVDDAARWRQAEERWGFRGAVLGPYSRTLRAPLGQALAQDRRWRLAYLDPLGAVFLRDGAAGSAPTVVLRGAGTERTGVPFSRRASAFDRATQAAAGVFFRNSPRLFLVEYLATLGALGLPGPAESLATAALAEQPDDPLLLRQRCAARLALGNAAAAVADCRAALEGAPDDVSIAQLLAIARQRAARP